VITDNALANDHEEIIERSRMYEAFAAAFRGSVDHNEVGLLSIAFPEDTPESRADYLNAFDCSVSSAACSLHGADYTSQERTSLFQDLVQFFEFFGVKRRDGAELPDHISVELEFLHYLTFCQLKGLEQDHNISGLLRAERDLLDRHVIPLAEHLKKGCKLHISYYVELTQKFVNYVKLQHNNLDAVVST